MNVKQMFDHFMSKKQNVIILIFTSGFEYIIKSCAAGKMNEDIEYSYCLDLKISYSFFLDTYQLDETDVSYEWFDEQIAEMLGKNNGFEELEKYIMILYFILLIHLQSTYLIIHSN